MKFSDKDVNTLIKKPNLLLADYHARIMLENVPKSILSFYENNKEKINGHVVIVRTKDDEAKAAEARNTCSKVLFVFSEDYWVTSYFSGVSQKIKLSQALINRAIKLNVHY